MCWFSSVWHRSTVHCIFEKLSGHKKLKNIAFVRDFEHFDNEIDFSGLKGWEGVKVDNIKIEKIVFVFTAGHGARRRLPRSEGPR